MIGRTDYEERREARIDRMEEMQEKNAAEAHAAYTRSHDLLDPIPFGQPNINGRLTGTLNRARNAMGKAVTLDKKSDYYAGKAEAARNNKAISSDDPAAIAKLEAKIAKLEAERDRIKAFNKEARKNGTEPAPWYELPYISKDIKSAKDRIEKLRRLDAMQDMSYRFEGGTIESNSESNRIMIFFDNRPAADMISALKSCGFRWAPSAKAWQRLRSPEALRSARRICGATLE